MAKLWPISPSVIEGDKPQETFSKGPPVILTRAVKIITAYLGPARLLKIRTSEKKRQPFQWKKNVWPVFPVLSSKKNSWNTLWRPIRYSDNYSGFHENIFQDLRGCWKHNFLKKGNLSSEEKILAYIFTYYRTWDMSENFFQGRQALLTTTVELIRAFSSDLRGCWKHNFRRKRQPFQ